MHKLCSQEVSQWVWDTKYRLRDSAGNPVDATPSATIERVARALSALEKDGEYWFGEFEWALKNGAVPGGRILANAGSHPHKNASLINCTVGPIMHDSMVGILDTVKEVGITLAAGCGSGVDVTTLRPRGAMVSGAGAETSGPIPFLGIFSEMCSTITSAGSRRGALHGVMGVWHPSVMEFIRAKNDGKTLQQFNLSVLVTDDFMDAVRDDAPWELVFPATLAEAGDINCVKTWQRSWPASSDEYTRLLGGRSVQCRVYQTVPAREVWDAILASNYTFSGPGFIHHSRVNRLNNLFWRERLDLVNPCGEQPLPANGACLLGSINLTEFVDDPFSPKAEFDFGKLAMVVEVFTRMLDNVVEIANLPLAAQTEQIIRTRRHGMGIMGLGSVFAMMGMVYGSHESIEITKKIMQHVQFTGWAQSAVLAKEKGCCPLMDCSGENDWSEYDKEMFMATHLGDTLPPETRAALTEHGARFTHHTSIAPTGTTSLWCNGVSGGIEPTFAHRYARRLNVGVSGEAKEVEVLSYELMLYRELVNKEADPDATDPANMLPDYFATARDIPWKAHIDVVAAAQPYVDGGISKTINVPADISFEEFSGVYEYAIQKGLKGCTVFRPSEAMRGVLLADKPGSKEYRFLTETGEIIDVPSGEHVTYEGRSCTPEELFTLTSRKQA